MTTPTVREVAIAAPRTHHMTRHTIVAPAVDNDGRSALRYVRALRADLLELGINGWTEYESVGYWHGKREPGTLFEIYRERDESARLALIARRAMPDQEAIQITVDAAPVRLVEA